MKKPSLSYQITIIFIVAFVITSAMLAVVLIGRLDSIFEHNIFDLLESEGKGLMSVENMNEFDSNPMLAHISYSSKSNAYSASTNINQYVSDEYAMLLVNKAVVQATSIQKYENVIDGKDIYYVILNYESFFGIQDNDIFIILTDGTLKSNMVKETTVQILLACLFAYLLGYLIIYLWVTKLVVETKKIAKSLNAIGQNHYKTKIITSRKDEIGDLVANIELMREKIIDNEKHKQEIIQGVSHDLKTPIAIIQSYAEALEDGLYSPQEVSKITLKQCSRLNAKVKKLLTLTRLGYFDISNRNFGETNMEDVVKDIAKLYSGKSKIDIMAHTQKINFSGDMDSWQIVLENLMDNAIRYAKSKIVITLDKNQLTIFNDGKHIAVDKLDNIFNAYEKGIDGNFGIGLSIVRRTLDLFGYSIKAKNLDDGVVFIIK